VTSLSKGANTGLQAAGLTGSRLQVRLAWQASGGVDADCSALLLAATTGKVRSDADFVFYNQPSGAGGAVTHTGKSGGVDSLAVDLSALPAEIDRVVVAASADGGTFGQLGALSVTVSDGSAELRFDITDATTETALVFLELYLRGGVWKAKAVGQGYDSGLAGLATEFGVSVDDEPAPSIVSLEKKRVVDLEKKLSTSNPAMLSLVKKAGVSLEKRGLGEHTARVALCLDISASMHGIYKNGCVQKLVERVLALGLRFDDDGAVDVWLFGKDGHTAEPITLDNLVGWTDAMLQSHHLEGATYYGKAMKLVREHYFGSAEHRTSPLADRYPVFVNFITDGEPSDRLEAEDQVRDSAYEPVFWQFMGIGKSFPFLSKLDDLSNRFIDNADFFSVTMGELTGRSPISDDALFERLMQEYPAWIPQARAKNLLT
jgi:stress response protein SCP2/uncharacterized protein YegL